MAASSNVQQLTFDEDIIAIGSGDNNNTEDVEFTSSNNNKKASVVDLSRMTSRDVDKAKRKRARAELRRRAKKYKRTDDQLSTKGVKDKKLKREMKEHEEAMERGAERAARAEILMDTPAGYLEADGKMEDTWRFTQDALKEHVDLRSQTRMFNLKLPTFGPYRLAYTRNGRHLLLGGRKGHLSVLDWARYKMNTELQVAETVRDVTFLHNDSLFAVAQKKNTYIYDHKGVELHCLKNHREVNRLDFLPYHYLLVTVGKSGMLRYQDTSTGEVVVEWKTKLGECKAMRHNPYNAVSCLGHGNGQVTMWTPNVSSPVVKMFTHRGPVLDLAFDKGGHYMVTSGLDGQMKVWDVRTYKELHAYYTRRPASTLDTSQNGLLGVGYGPHVQVWKDALATKQQSPYMSQSYNGETVSQIRFCPYEDILGVAHSNGFASMVVPGAGEANFDSMEVNPFISRKQKREAVVHSLLDKLPSDMIALDPNSVAAVDPTAKTSAEREEVKVLEEKNKQRGGSTTSKRLKRKQKNVVDQKVMERRRRAERVQREQEQAKREAEQLVANGGVKSALSRFSSSSSSKARK